MNIVMYCFVKSRVRACVTIPYSCQNDEPPPLEELSGDGAAPQPQPNESAKPDSTPTEAADFPLDHLAKLDDQLNRPKWVVPVRPDDDLERLLRASIKLCQEGGLVCMTILILLWLKLSVPCVS